MSNGDALHSLPSATADTNTSREADRDGYAAKIRTFMAGEIKEIIRQQDLNKMKRIHPVRELRARLDLAMSKRDQGAVDRISTSLAWKIAKKDVLISRREITRNVTKSFCALVSRALPEMRVL